MDRLLAESKLIHHQVNITRTSTHLISSNIYKIFVEFFPPPNITLTEINMDQLTFTWDSIAMSSSGVQYFVNASNCVCPSTTNSNSVRCNFTNISNLHECTLIIQSLVCGITGSASDPFIMTVKGQFIIYNVIFVLMLLQCYLFSS